MAGRPAKPWVPDCFPFKGKGAEFQEFEGEKSEQQAEALGPQNTLVFLESSQVRDRLGEKPKAAEVRSANSPISGWKRPIRFVEGTRSRAFGFLSMFEALSQRVGSVRYQWTEAGLDVNGDHNRGRR